MESILDLIVSFLKIIGIGTLILFIKWLINCFKSKIKLQKKPTITDDGNREIRFYFINNYIKDLVNVRSFVVVKDKEYPLEHSNNCNVWKMEHNNIISLNWQRLEKIVDWQQELNYGPYQRFKKVYLIVYQNNNIIYKKLIDRKILIDQKNHILQSNDSDKKDLIEKLKNFRILENGESLY